MKTRTWSSMLALVAATGLVVAPAAAQQTGTPGGADKPAGAAEKQEPAEKKAPAAARMSPEQVKAVQQALKDKGHDPGPVDGRLGPKTRTALKEFQKAEGLQETGRLDRETMAKLGVEGTSGAASPGTETGKPRSSMPSGSTGTSPGKEMKGESQTGGGTGGAGGGAGTGGSK